MDDNELNKAASIARRYAKSESMPELKLMAQTMLYLDDRLDRVENDLAAEKETNRMLSEALDSASMAGNRDRITVDYMRRAIVEMFPHFAEAAND